jgi:molecular chaperone Hsp33
MSSPDHIQRFTFDNTDVRGELVGLQKSYQQVLQKQTYPASVQQHLGELLAAAALLGDTIKFEGTLSLQVQTTGPISMLVAELNTGQGIRGIARYDEAAEDDQLILGAGQLIITLDPKQGQRYQGIVSLEASSTQSSGLATSLETYFTQSELLETRIWLAADDAQAAGFLLHKLPVSEQQDDDAWARLTHLGSTLKDEELLTLQNDELLHRLYHEESTRLYPLQPLAFYCTCSKQRTSSALMQLGYSELCDIVLEEKKVSVDCQFCNQHYSFNQADIDDLFPAEAINSGNKKPN